MKRLLPITVVLALWLATGGCRRAEEEPWGPVEPALTLASNLEITDPPDRAITLRRTFAPGAERAWKARLDSTVRMRGRPHAPIALVVEDTMTLRERVEEVGPDGARVLVDVRDPQVSMEPATEGIPESRERGLEAVRLALAWDPDGTFRRIAGATGEGPDQPDRAVEEALRRLVPALPGRSLVAGETWPFRAVHERALPGDRPARFVLAGRYRLQGMAELDGAPVAVVDLEYDVTAAGETAEGAVTGRIREATGRGRTLFLVRPDDGTTVRAQAAESTHVFLELREGRKSQVSEQLSTLKFDLTVTEDGP